MEDLYQLLAAQSKATQSVLEAYQLGAAVRVLLPSKKFIEGRQRHALLELALI